MDTVTLKSNSEIMSLSKSQLKGHWMEAAVVVFLFQLVASITDLGFFDNLFRVSYVNIGGEYFKLDPNYYFKLLVTYLIMGPFMLGLSRFFLKFARNENPPIETFFSGLKQFVPSMVLYIIRAIFIFLWTLLLIIPGIIAYCKYSQAYFILNDEPGLSSLDALKKSTAMMDGYKAHYVVLCFSFIGWELLLYIVTIVLAYLFTAVGSIALGTIVLWLTAFIGQLVIDAYFNLSLANFYDNLKKYREQENYDSTVIPESFSV